MFFETLFDLGMKRSLGTLVDPPDHGFHIGIGENGTFKSTSYTLGIPDWLWPRDKIPESSGSVAILHCYHFLEHLPGEDAISFLVEAQRVLKPGGILQFCVPYYNSSMQGHDLTHKSFWNEQTFRNLFSNPYYDMTEVGFHWKLRVHYQVIAGIVERNLAMLGQLVREA